MPEVIVRGLSVPYELWVVPYTAHAHWKGRIFPDYLLFFSSRTLSVLWMERYLERNYASFSDILADDAVGAPLRYQGQEGERLLYRGQALTTHISTHPLMTPVVRQNAILMLDFRISPSHRHDTVMRWMIAEARQIIMDALANWTRRYGLAPLNPHYLYLGRFKSFQAMIAMHGVSHIPPYTPHALYVDWRLAHAPPYILDTFITHELAHLYDAIAGHTESFYRIWEAHYPQGPALMRWFRNHYYEFFGPFAPLPWAVDPRAKQTPLAPFGLYKLCKRHQRVRDLIGIGY